MKKSDLHLHDLVLPVDQIFIIIALHFVLDGRLEVTDPLEGQLEVRLQALIGRLQAFNVHFLRTQAGVSKLEQLNAA